MIQFNDGYALSADVKAKADRSSRASSTGPSRSPVGTEREWHRDPQATTSAIDDRLGYAPLLEMPASQRFAGVVANDWIDFNVRRGEVHTLFGETAPARTPDAGPYGLPGR